MTAGLLGDDALHLMEQRAHVYADQVALGFAKSNGAAYDFALVVPLLIEEVRQLRYPWNRHDDDPHELVEATTEIARHHNLIVRLRDNLTWALNLMERAFTESLTSDEEVEEAAWAIYDSAFSQPGNPAIWDRLPQDIKDSHRREARAAITSARLRKWSATDADRLVEARRFVNREVG